MTDPATGEPIANPADVSPAEVAILALNPAVDMTYEVDRILPDQKVHAHSTRFDPGGNGINVARALERLSVQSHSFCILAGETGIFLERLLGTQIGLLTTEWVEGETRINGTVIEYLPGNQYEVSGVGPAIPRASLDTLLHRFIGNAGEGFGVITGSIQPDLPDTLYAELVDRVQSAGGKAVVDAQGALLKNAIEAGPFLIKPNHYELEQLTGQVIDGIEDTARVARRLQQNGVTHVCISMGRNGALLCTPDNSYHASTPKVKIKSTVGAGDSMVAGLVTGLLRGEPVEKTLRLGVACGAGTVGHPGTELFSHDEIPVLMEQVSIRILDL